MFFASKSTTPSSTYSSAYPDCNGNSCLSSHEFSHCDLPVSWLFSFTYEYKENYMFSPNLDCFGPLRIQDSLQKTHIISYFEEESINYIQWISCSLMTS